MEHGDRRHDDLIFDLGLHRGEDTEFYLKKGYRVLAVDANPTHCVEVETNFAEAVRDGRLTVINRAIADHPGEVTFYESAKSDWGTIHPDWAARNTALGVQTVPRQVMATTVGALIAEHGVPYYAKIDLEGVDTIALAGFSSAPTKPKYISIESEKVSFQRLRNEFQTFTQLGYDQFKVVSQWEVAGQKLPKPALEGRFVEHTFQYGSSGAFGEEAMGNWLSAEDALEVYRPIFLRYMLTGDDPLVRSRLARRILRKLGFVTGWHDTHAKLASA